MENIELLTELRPEKEIYSGWKQGHATWKRYKDCLMKAKKVKGNMKDFFRES